MEPNNTCTMAAIAEIGYSEAVVAGVVLAAALVVAIAIDNLAADLIVVVAAD